MFRGSKRKEVRVSSVLKASIGSSPLHSTSHPSITEWERGTDSIAWSQQSSRANSRERGKERKWETQNRGGGRGWQSQVWRREIQKDRAREHERDANATHRSCPLLWLSSITLPMFSPSLWLSSWPFGSVTPVSAAIPQPSPVIPLPPHTAHTGGSSVVSGAWTSHQCCKTEQILWRTKCDRWAADLWSGHSGTETGSQSGNIHAHMGTPYKHNQSNTHTLRCGIFYEYYDCVSLNMPVITMYQSNMSFCNRWFRLSAPSINKLEWDKYAYEHMMFVL